MLLACLCVGAVPATRRQVPTLPLPANEVLVLNATLLPPKLPVMARDHSLPPYCWKPWVARLKDESLLLSCRKITDKCGWRCVTRTQILTLTLTLNPNP